MRRFWLIVLLLGLAGCSRLGSEQAAVQQHILAKSPRAQFVRWWPAVPIAQADVPGLLEAVRVDSNRRNVIDARFYTMQMLLRPDDATHVVRVMYRGAQGSELRDSIFIVSKNGTPQETAIAAPEMCDPFDSWTQKHFPLGQR